MTNELISLISDLAIALSFIVALVFGIVQVRVAARDRRERLTLETLRAFHSREFAELIHFINSHDLPASYEEMRALPASDQVMYIQYSQQMESLGILVAENFISIDLVDKTLGSFVTTTWEKYKIMFEDIRAKSPDPFLGEYFQWLAERIEERMKINPRQPFYKTHAA